LLNSDKNRDKFEVEEVELIKEVKKPKSTQKIAFQEKVLKGPVKREKHRISVNDILDEFEDELNDEEYTNDEYDEDEE
jgi:hypothetical protein